MTFFGALITIILPFIIEKLLIKFELAGAFYFLAGFAFLCSLCGFTFIERFSEKKPKNLFKRFKKSLKLKIFKIRKFNYWMIAGIIGFFGYLIPIYTIVRDNYKRKLRSN
jgi:hypothetical protein